MKTSEQNHNRLNEPTCGSLGVMSLSNELFEQKVAIFEEKIFIAWSSVNLFWKFLIHLSVVPKFAIVQV